MLFLQGPRVGDACTRIFHNANPSVLLCSRSLNWHCSLEEQLWLLPRGLKADGGIMGFASYEWESRYGSLLLISKKYLNGAVEGLNEQGLAAHALYFGTAQHDNCPEQPAVAQIYWVRYLLDHFASVSEVLEHIVEVPIVEIQPTGLKLPLHIALEDSFGDSAILEYVQGKCVVHHGRDYTVMTNAPSFDEQLHNLYRYRHFGGSEVMPLGSGSQDRFVRAAYQLAMCNLPVNDKAAIDLAFALIRSIAAPTQPILKADEELLWWTSVIDLRRKIYYFCPYPHGIPLCVDLKSHDFASFSDVKILDPYAPIVAWVCNPMSLT